MRARLCASLLVAAALAGVAGAGDSPSTRVTILAVNPNVGRAAFHLSCGPTGGDIPSPERACAALAAASGLVLSPQPFVCRGGPTSWWDITVSGRLDGNPFLSHTSSCWTPQMGLIGELGIAAALQEHLLPRRRRTLHGGQRRVFPPGALRPGDLVVCTTHNRRLELGVPVDAEHGGSLTGYGGAGVKTVTLTVTLHIDGSVTASCT
jgi:hypothetical protein